MNTQESDNIAQSLVESTVTHYPFKSKIGYELYDWTLDFITDWDENLAMYNLKFTFFFIAHSSRR